MLQSLSQSANYRAPDVDWACPCRPVTDEWDGQNIDTL